MYYIFCGHSKVCQHECSWSKKTECQCTAPCQRACGHTMSVYIQLSVASLWTLHDSVNTPHQQRRLLAWYASFCPNVIVACLWKQHSSVQVHIRVVNPQILHVSICPHTSVAGRWKQQVSSVQTHMHVAGMLALYISVPPYAGVAYLWTLHIFVMLHSVYAPHLWTLQVTVSCQYTAFERRLV